MPTTRRAAGAATAGKQSTLSFNHRVTKASAPVGKQAAKAAALSAPAKQSPLAKQIEDEVSAAAEDEAVVEIKPEDEVAGGQVKVEDVVVADDDEEEVEVKQVEVKEEEVKSEAEVKALKMTDRQIETYWRGVEAERIAKRVHQEDLGTPEKVLRYFDVSSQYGVCSRSFTVSLVLAFLFFLAFTPEKRGASISLVVVWGRRIVRGRNNKPLLLVAVAFYIFIFTNPYNSPQPCIGLTRLKRWQRANRLGLNPPVEVLAVLLKEEKKIVDVAAAANSKTGSGKGRVKKAPSSSSSSSKKDVASEPSQESVRLQTAHIDEILNSTTVGA